MTIWQASAQVVKNLALECIAQIVSNALHDPQRPCRSVRRLPFSPSLISLYKFEPHAIGTVPA